MSFYTAARFAEGLAGSRAVRVLAGRRHLHAERSASNDATPIFMAHGRADNVAHELGHSRANF